MDYKWDIVLRQADKTHQEVRTMLRKGIGPQRIGSHDEFLEDCTKDLMLNLATLQGNPIPVVTRWVSNKVSVL